MPGFIRSLSSGLIGALGLAGAVFAQTATPPPAADEAEAPQGAGTSTPKADPFLSSSDAKPFDPPPYSLDNRRSITGGHDFDFESVFQRSERRRRNTQRTSPHE